MSANKHLTQVEISTEVDADQQTDKEKSDLLATISQMNSSLTVMKDIIQKANFIALNASIEAARTQTQTENFSLVADQVRRQAERTEELSTALEQEVGQLEVFALRALAVNLADKSQDIVDKIDRNLFERNCDMQAWATYPEVQDAVRFTSSLEPTDLLKIREIISKKDPSNKENDVIIEAIKRLEILSRTYQVYLDIFIIDAKGRIAATAINTDLIGTDLSNRMYFREVMRNKAIHVTDMFFDDLLQSYTVSYCAPILNESGECLGVLATRFNWFYVQEMVDSMPLRQSEKIYLISKEGQILSSTGSLGILKDGLSWSMAGESAVKKDSGFSIECFRNGQLGAWGFCHTFGYNAYPGKAWSAIVAKPIELNKNRFIHELVTREPEARKQVANEANHQLSIVTERIKSHVENINTINNETNMLAVNAAIQAGVAGADGEAFSVIASEIGKLARQSEDFVNQINSHTTQLGESVINTVYTRLGEAAFDTIDKIDRNLFERYCDVQAFASFDIICKFATADKSSILDLLHRLHAIYEVYHDILLLDREGNIFASATHRELIGQNQSDRPWFRESLGGHIVVTDFYFSKSINDYTVTFASPVKNNAGEVIGVMTTRFNCGFINDIMKATVIGGDNEVYLVNQKGVVIASPNHEGILEDSFSNLKAFRNLNRNPYGYTIENESPAEDSALCAIGYAKTKGYLNYAGKGWSVLIKHVIKENKKQTSKGGLKIIKK